MPVMTTVTRLSVAAETPLRRPTVLISPSWIPKTNSRARMRRSKPARLFVQSVMDRVST